MPLIVGKPPADTSPMATLLVALQELYDDLAEFVTLRKKGGRCRRAGAARRKTSNPIPLNASKSGEHQVTLHKAGSAGVPRHRDALPDGGRKHGRRRITCMVCCGSEVGGDEEEEAVASDAAGPSGSDGSGAVSIWPPRLIPPSGLDRHSRNNRRLQLQAHVLSQVVSRRSFTGSDGGTSFSESDTCSLRSFYVGGMSGLTSSVGHVAAAGGVAAGGAGAPGGSVSSSVWAEAASGMNDPIRDDDAGSVNESLDGGFSVAATAAGWGGVASSASLSQLPGSAAALADEARTVAWSAALAAVPSGGEQAALSGVAGAQPRASTAATAVLKGVEWVEADGEMVLRVAPLPGRLLLFLSGAVDHSHQPLSEAAADLVSVTAWFQ